jgi:nucleoside-diphosphate-sugar epimerase
MELRGKVALVTGASGLVGSYAVRRLLQEGVHVRALVRRPEAAEPLQALGAQPVLGDMTDEHSLRQAVAGAHLIVHSAVAANPADLELCRRVNVEGTRTLLEAALAAGCCERLVYLSSIAVYDMEGRQTVDEDTPLIQQGDPYSLTKAEAEPVLRAAMDKGLPTIIFRLPMILGVHPHSYWGTLVPRALVAGQFPLVGDGSFLMPYVEVENLTGAIIAALQADAAVGQAFNVVDGHTPWRRYIDYLHRGPLPSLPEEQAPLLLRLRCHILGDRFARLVGYTPRRTFDQVMREIAQALAAG